MIINNDISEPVNNDCYTPSWFYIIQLELQDPKMEVLYHMFAHILGVYPLT